MYSVKILKDSMNILGDRLTTWEIEYPRIVHSEVMTMREASRNAASSRAIPLSKLRERILRDPVVPVHFGKNQKGMQAREQVEDTEAARQWWLDGLDLMAAHHRRGEELGIHKQIVNRVIEPWMFITVIFSATNFENMFFLRYHPDAQPEFEWLARTMYEAYRAAESSVQVLQPGEWHLPFINDEDRMLGIADQKKLSAARCGRVSYLTHAGKREIEEDFRLHDDLCGINRGADEPLHMSPFEHVAMALGESKRVGNFTGFMQYRKEFQGEAGPKRFTPKP